MAATLGTGGKFDVGFARGVLAESLDGLELTSFLLPVAAEAPCGFAPLAGDAAG
jgi:hypothetical protein